MAGIFEIEKVDPDRFGSERFNVRRDTKQVYFSYTPEFTDSDSADACVQVLTSDGHKGTCSHLNIFQDPCAFARDLRESLGWGEIPAVINGGRDDIEASVQLTTGLVRALKANGFVISLDPKHSDVGGAFTRTTTLRKDGVKVCRKKYGKEIIEDEVELEFPRVE